MVQLIVYVPEDALERVKEAMFAAGAGRIGNYDRCSWQTLGTGQFRPLAGANPAIGKVATEERLQDWKVELVCDEKLVDKAVAAMKAAHPYETPAFFVFR